ncbi:MAG TPA: hypothetical protein VJ044_03265 [Candidatus Hodarchaeales archaeon]|nr:hypothetical protein [Candidatus Hodarchaeales archaeon]
MLTITGTNGRYLVFFNGALLTVASTQEEVEKILSVLKLTKVVQYQSCV